MTSDEKVNWKLSSFSASLAPYYDHVILNYLDIRIAKGRQIICYRKLTNETEIIIER